MGPYKYLPWLLVLNIAFQLISDITAGKIILLFGTGVSVTVLYFPVTYIISDIITEVYGYARARTILWMTMAASVLAGLVYQLVVFIPPAPFFEANEAYTSVFGIVPRILVGGWIAVFLGDIVNNYVLSKMKLATKGKHLWMRTIGSTIAGQAVNTACFYIIALYGVLPDDVMVRAIIAAWLIKVIVETIMTPVTYIVTNKLKQSEGLDVYDSDTNFSPFIIKIKQENKS